MPWSETSPMDERARFALDAFSECFTMTELFERYGISRRTGYKWIERYRRGRSRLRGGSQLIPTELGSIRISPCAVVLCQLHRIR